MPIPEDQLETWSGRGSTGQFRDTYNHLKDTLEDRAAPHAGKKFRVFRQGSYENDTNVHSDSDVDTVIMLQSTFHYNLNDLTDQEKVNFRAAYPNDATYVLADFKREVVAWLVQQYPGGYVTPGNKAVYIARNGKLPREADVLICTQYKDYWGFANVNDTDSFISGVHFYNRDNTAIINYPEVHSANCSDRHQATGEQFKRTARILKNMRNRMIRDGLLAEGVAPSYYIEGLLSNVPDPSFVARHDATVVNCMRWLLACDRNALRCAHRMRPLIGDNSPTAWPLANCNTFIDGVVSLWNDWR